MTKRNLGPFRVSGIGFGEMPLSIPGRPSREQAIEALTAGLDAGIDFIDTAFGYRDPLDAECHGEVLVAEALAGWNGPKEQVLVATKGGHYRHPHETPPAWPLCGDPRWIVSCAKASALTLGVDAIDLYYYHRPDPLVPWAESVGALADLLSQGVIRWAGVSNADRDQIIEARGILGDKLVAVQNSFSVLNPASKPELDLCGELGLAFVAYAPVGGRDKATGLADSAAALVPVAQAHGVSVYQVALAWILAQGEHVFAIPGARRPASILDSYAAVDLVLAPQELAAIDQAVGL
ncbi:MAG: aldo/keto reductase [Bifidobacteriaceae bacterium]|jgi:aryl-alcohol dehydrogenase-like predicted oxidoreductase|nr:aldo/keto reductase [Bifidobacteriaceae bacterium]